ncbi:MAG: hypothetical protein JRC68_08010 [Deltaproteobacteria bacterium]|nr:hypothetical protein [Deltaproteobacteria bacterium]
MKRGRDQSLIKKRRKMRLLVFPAVVLVIYGILFVIMPDKASAALRSSGKVFTNILMPLCLVFIFMFVLNLFFKSASITKFLGRGAGIKTIILSAAAGIISIGPIYAWYPMLKALREKGAGNSFIAIFLGNRAVKPFLLPMMISFFGWIYVLILTIFTIIGSIVVGYCVDILVKEDVTTQADSL